MNWLSKLLGYWTARCSGCRRECGDRFMHMDGLMLYCGICFRNPWLWEAR